MIASLPMYDWPQVRGATDALWAAIRDAIRARGLAAPDHLDRDRENRAVWTDPALVLSQTCAMPWRQALHRHTDLVATPDYGVEGCAPGFYCSAIAVRADDPRSSPTEFGAARCAFNAIDSQSGRAVWGAQSFAEWVETGSHAASVEAVAAGQADIAAIDAVSWRLARRFLPSARSLRIIQRTPPTPGLPLVTAKGSDTGLLASAVAEGVANLAQEHRRALGIVGLVRFEARDYVGA